MPREMSQEDYQRQLADNRHLLGRLVRGQKHNHLTYIGIVVHLETYRDYLNRLSSRNQPHGGSFSYKPVITIREASGTTTPMYLDEREWEVAQ